MNYLLVFMARGYRIKHPFLKFVNFFLLLLFLKDFANIISNLDIVELDFPNQTSQEDLEICAKMIRIRKNFLELLNYLLKRQFL